MNSYERYYIGHALSGRCMLLVLAYVVHSSVAVGVFWLWYIIRRSFVGLVSCVGVYKVVEVS